MEHALPEQAAWSPRRFILQDLASVDRGVTPWVVVNMHRPIYTSSSAGVGPTSVIRVAEDLRAALEPIFMLYQVRWFGAAELSRDAAL